MSGVAEPLLRVHRLCKSYLQRRPFTQEKYAVHAFENVNLTVLKGHTLAIVGESGAGKTSLARCLALIEKPDRGEIWFNGENVARLDSKSLFPLRRKIQFLFQDSASSLNPRLTAAEIVSEPMLIQRIGTASERRGRALDLMRQVGLPPQNAEKTMLEFSGGQRQRLALARALTLQPDLLILDESLSNLDLARQEMILQLLAELQKAHSLTYIHISHDLRLVETFADEIAVMHDGRIVESKPCEELLAHPEESYTRRLLQAMPSIERILRERPA